MPIIKMQLASIKAERSVIVATSLQVKSLFNVVIPLWWFLSLLYCTYSPHLRVHRHYHIKRWQGFKCLDLPHLFSLLFWSSHYGFLPLRGIRYHERQQFSNHILLHFERCCHIECLQFLLMMAQWCHRFSFSGY